MSIKGAVISGAGLSTALFTALGLPKLLGQSVTGSPGYPLLIFGMISIFVLVSGLFAVSISDRALNVVIAAMAGFFGLAVFGAYELNQEIAKTPTVAVMERLEIDPAHFRKRDDQKPFAIKMFYEIPRLGSGGEPIPLDHDFIKVRNGDSVLLRIGGLDDMYDEYTDLFDQNNMMNSVIKANCSGLHQQDVCDALNYVPKLH